jgi:TonB family protein
VNSDWIDIELLEDYLDGKLDSKAMHRIEREALEDPFVAQALAGLSESPRRGVQTVSLLQKQLYERIAEQQVVKKESVFTWQRLSVAAAAAVMFISVSIVFFMRDKEARDRIAKTQPKRVEVNIAPLPSVLDSAKAGDLAVNTTVKTPERIDVGKISPRREARPGPVQAEEATTFKAAGAAATVDTAAVLSSAATIAKTRNVNARIATVAPAVSAPVGGWVKLDSYINENNKLIKDGLSGQFVEVSFEIDAEGNPTAVKVLKSASEAFDAEAIRLIKEGPKWEQPKTAGSKVNYTIAF